MSPDLVITILTSTVISSIVSGICLLINEYLRRKSEEKRIMLETAIRLTQLRGEQTLEVIKMSSKKVLWPAPINTFEKTLRLVEKIWEGNDK